MVLDRAMRCGNDSNESVTTAEDCSLFKIVCLVSEYKNVLYMQLFP